MSVLRQQTPGLLVEPRMVLVNDPLRVRMASMPGIAPEHVEAVSRIQALGLPRIVQPRVVLEDDSEPATALFVVRRGWAFSSKLLPNGGRQIVEFYVAGDVIGSANGFRQTATEAAETVTETVLTEIPLEAVKRLARQSPAVTDVLLNLLAHDRAALADRLVDLGRRDSVARVGHLLLDLWRRLLVVGVAMPSGYPCPLSQYVIADATGLTAIHVNRVLRELRESGLVTFRHGHVRFQDFDRLAHACGFEQAGTRVRPARRGLAEQGVA